MIASDHRFHGLVSLLVVPMLGIVLAPRGAGAAEFVPGMIYVGESYSDGCFRGPHRIWEVNPKTGEWRVLVAPGCWGFSGLTFTPDGSRLRAAAIYLGEVEEIDADGNIVTVLDQTDGLMGLRYITYDAEGNFFANNVGDILRFPAEGGPGQVVADFFDGVRAYSTIAFAADGDMYLAPGKNGAIQESQDYVLRFDPKRWEASIFDSDFPLTDDPRNVVTDRSGYVYLSFRRTIYRYRIGDPASRAVISDGVFTPFSLALSPDERKLIGYRSLSPRLEEYYTEVRSVDVRDGTVEVLAVIDGLYIDFGGIAVVPYFGPAGDTDTDGDVDVADLAWFLGCVTGPDGTMQPACGLTDLDHDLDVDFADFGILQQSVMSP